MATSTASVCSGPSSSSSSSIRIRYPAAAIPKTLQEVSKALSTFGEIARLDSSLMALNGTVLVTYFDVRSALAVLAVHAPNAEAVPQASQDFRRVSITPRALQEAVSRLGGLHTFGEIAGVSRNGDHIEFEFFDTRAAHRVILSVRGSKAVENNDAAQQNQHMKSLGVGSVHQQHMIDQLCTLMNVPGIAHSTAAQGSHPNVDASSQLQQHKSSGHVMAQDAQNVDAPGALTKNGATTQVHQRKLAALKKAQVAAQSFSQIADKRVTQETHPRDGVASQVRQPQKVVAKPEELRPPSGALSLSPPPGLEPPTPFSTPARVYCSGLQGWERSCTVPVPSVDEPMFVTPVPERNAAPLTNPVTATTQGRKENPQEGSRDVNTMDNDSKHVMFEIDPQRIVSGEDTRTTVMVRNIPKPCSREDFFGLLAKCGLSNRHDFLHIPFDKRGKLRCGVAFVNFLTPVDVLRLIRSQDLMAKVFGATNARPALSYARLQGISELTQHLGIATVAKDTTKRVQTTSDLSVAETSAPASSDELSDSQRSSSDSQGTQRRMTRVRFEDGCEGRAHSGVMAN